MWHVSFILSTQHVLRMLLCSGIYLKANMQLLIKLMWLSVSGILRIYNFVHFIGLLVGLATVCSMLDSHLSNCNDIVTTGAYSFEELLKAIKRQLSIFLLQMYDSTVSRSALDHCLLRNISKILKFAAVYLGTFIPKFNASSQNKILCYILMAT